MITLPTTIPAIRSERHEFRLSETGRWQAANASSAAVRRRLVAIARAQNEDGWADIASIHSDVYPGISDRRNVRHRLGLLEAEGLVESRRHPPAGVTEVAIVKPVEIQRLNRRRAASGQSILPEVRPPRVDQIAHHLLTVHAALLILSATGGRLVHFAGDEDMRSSERRGKRIRAGTVDLNLPDARLAFDLPSGQRREAEIEVLTSKYSDEVIQKKVAMLKEGTIFAVPTEDLARRAAALSGCEVLLLVP